MLKATFLRIPLSKYHDPCSLERGPLLQRFNWYIASISACRYLVQAALCLQRGYNTHCAASTYMASIVETRALRAGMRLA